MMMTLLQMNHGKEGNEKQIITLLRLEIFTLNFPILDLEVYHFCLIRSIS